MKLPKKISPCPIVEAIVELRFEATLPEEIIPGLLYPALKENFPSIEKLPVAEIPPVIRNSDPNLKFSPYYKFSGDIFTIQVGPRTFSILCNKTYPGWSEFLARIKTAFTALKEVNIVKDAVRLGLRYINFFPNEDIFKQLNIKLEFNGEPLVGQHNILRNETERGGLVHIIQVASNVTITRDPQQLSGSTFDIDVINSQENIMDNFIAFTEEAHEKEKEAFFSLLSDSYLKSLNPEY